MERLEILLEAKENEGLTPHNPARKTDQLSNVVCADSQNIEMEWKP